MKKVFNQVIRWTQNFSRGKSILYMKSTLKSPGQNGHFFYKIVENKNSNLLEKYEYSILIKYSKKLFNRDNLDFVMEYQKTILNNILKNGC